MIGFKPQAPRRIAVRNEQGAKVGYIASVNGRQVYQTPEGQTIAYIKAWKYSVAPARQGAQGGSQMQERDTDWWC